ncbi:hypothetical protein SAMN00790413_04346 [Deinococcus hopiensis KR-140]|uniref:Uncharacterized protein n=1 Tax=Deinococcus hopiensis KR-140 TaxID=695939 RepID=A0A1W1UQ94_9DEIO|nr:hypothetical protein SAMN00790413_04346 [Deinococcus hopiensis KR-140]
MQRALRGESRGCAPGVCLSASPADVLFPGAFRGGTRAAFPPLASCWTAPCPVGLGTPGSARSPEPLPLWGFSPECRALRLCPPSPWRSASGRAAQAAERKPGSWAGKMNSKLVFLVSGQGTCPRPRRTCPEHAGPWFNSTRLARAHVPPRFRRVGRCPRAFSHDAAGLYRPTPNLWTAIHDGKRCRAPAEVPRRPGDRGASHRSAPYPGNLPQPHPGVPGGERSARPRIPR